MSVNESFSDDDIPASEARELIRRSLASSMGNVLELAPWNLAQPFRMPSPATPMRQREADGLPSTFADIDNIIGGLRPGEIITIASLPSSGASTLAQNLTRRIALQSPIHPAGANRNPVALYSLDMEARRVARRMTYAQARVDPFPPLTKELGADEQALLEVARRQLSEAMIEINDIWGVSASYIRDTSLNLQDTKGLDLVVVDRLNSIGSGDRAQPLTASMPALKKMATELNVPVILLFTIDPNRVGDTAVRPKYNVLPAAIQLYSDIIAILHRPEQWTPKLTSFETIGDRQKGLEVVEFAVAYQKGGRADVARLAFNTRWARFDAIRWDM